MHGAAVTGGTRPCSGFIDPARESNDGIERNEGLREAFLRFNAEVFQSDGVTDVDASNFMMVETGGVAPPVVTDADYVDGDKSYVHVQWGRPLTAREWTTIIADVYNAVGDPVQNVGDLGGGNEPDRIDIGFLPADVDQSGHVDPLDLLAFKQLVNFHMLPSSGCSAVKADYADLNRCGVVSPIDLLTFKRLIKGINPATQSWAFQTMNNARP